MKRLLVLFVFLFTMLLTYNVFAQELGLLRRGYEISIPEKIQKLVLDPLPVGTYSVGAGGYFSSIDSVFNKLSIDGIAGEVILELIDGLYTAPTNDFGFLLNGPIPGVGPNSRVTIKPAANKNVTIEGNGLITVSFLNSNYVTIDGVGLTGSTTLTIHTLDNAVYSENEGLAFLDNSDHNVIQNIIIIHEAAIGFGAGVAPMYGTASPDSNLIQNNFVRRCGIGLYASGYSSPVKAIGNIIRGNKIGSETDSLITWGIQVDYCQNSIVENNIVENLGSTHSIAGYNYGIKSYFGSGDIIRNNIVHKIKPSTGYNKIGILLSGGAGQTGSNNQVYNNMVYDIQGSSTNSNSRVTGIQMWYQDSPKIYYNSVYLSGIGSNVRGSAALFLDNNCTNIDAKNNILVNTRDESPYCASAIYDYTASNLTTDYNDLYYEPNQYNCLARTGNTKYNTLAEWQATGKDLNSITEMPHFASTDLHINWGYTTMIDGHATPIAGITTDFEGEPRNTLTPDIGADEGAVVPVELTSFTASANGAEVILNWSTATELNNYGFEIQRKALGGEFATVAFVKGQGTTTQPNQYSFADKNLDEGKYFYRLKQLDFGGKYEYSQIVEVDVRTLDNYTLEQNYPNPFNPTTTIGFGIPASPNPSEGGALVTLKVYDILGNEVKTLVNKEIEAGYHSIDFNASDLPSGVYFYQLRAGSFIETKKMTLLR